MSETDEAMNINELMLPLSPVGAHAVRDKSNALELSNEERAEQIVNVRNHHWLFRLNIREYVP